MRTNAIRWFALVIILAASGAGLYYQYANTSPCAHSISYAIGAVDGHFGITDSALVSDAESAAAIWNKAAGKTVLAYDPKAGLKINLIYDAREANARLGNEIARQQANADTVRAALDALQAQYAARQTAYNQEVDAINARGGATPREAAVLAAERASLNTLADSVNSQITAFNAGVAALNETIAEFNRTAGHTFKEGEFIRDASGERIDIYEFIGATQLERVLAHEFGHALGLDHNGDPKSIMFAKNESGKLVPTKADLAALRAVCGD